jgi:DNA-binding response OmpR family regulator
MARNDRASFGRAARVFRDRMAEPLRERTFREVMISPPAARPVVLAVLDDSERSALLKMSLEGRGWTVVRAHSCEQARTRALEQPIDALLTDLVLTDGSAFGLLRSLPVAPRVSIVLTWGNQHGIRDRIAAAGFDAHLVRPITAEEIDHVLRAKLADKRERELAGPRGTLTHGKKPHEVEHLSPERRSRTVQS